ncbi:hypothetical protein N8787_03375 [Opitutaceae bacterium]|nr:hypothetical protein [Opitutaceae bacterium]
MKIRTQILISFLVVALAGAINADDSNAEGAGELFGPYVALIRNREVVKDVKVEENGRIYLLLNPKYKEKEIILKNSSGNKSGYRKWFNGEFELVSPANQGKAPNKYTDWVVTSGNYVEYYLDGSLILHLKKSNL